VNLSELNDLIQNDAVEKRLEAVRLLSQLDSLPEQLFICALGDEDWRVRKETVGYFMQQPDASLRVNFIADLLSHPDNAGLRNAAIEILIGLGSQTIKVLLERLHSVDAEVRKFIVDILGEIGHPSCVPELIPFLQDEDENVRYAIVETLGKLKSPEAVTALLDLLDTSDAGLQFTVFEALTSIGEGVPVSRILPHAENTLLRKSVLNCLGQLGDAEAIPVLLKGLADPIRKNREVALVSFGRLIKSLSDNDCPEVDQQSEQVVDQLLDYLQHADSRYRSAACYVLSLFANDRIISRMLPLLAEEDLRAEVVAAIRLVPRVIVTSLVSEVRLDDENAIYLIFLLGELGYSEISPLAIEGISSPDPQLRYASILSLGKIKAVQATTLLSDALTDEIPEICAAASEALSLIGADEPAPIIKAVSPYLESSDLTLRLLAVRTLGALSTDKVESCLLAAIKDVAAEVRCEALRGLAGYKSQRLLNTLALALTDEVADVRRLAADAVSAFPAQQSRPILEHAMDDTDAWVRMAAIRSLADDEENNLLPVLQRGLSDPVGLVVIAALESAYRLLADNAIPLLQNTLLHEDADVAGTAVRLLLNVVPETELLNHDQVRVRLLTVNQMLQTDEHQWRPLFEARLENEPDAQVRQALEDALRRGGLGG
jgi:HEAT repeat protein